MKLLCLLTVLVVALTFCTKKSAKCGKITNVTLFKMPAQKDTIRVTLLVQFSTTDSREFSTQRNEKKHPNQFWYDFIGTEYCIGGTIPD